MPSCHDEDDNFKPNLLKEQLGKLDVNLLRNTTSAGHDLNKDCDQNNMKIKQDQNLDQDNIKHANEMLITDETSSKLHEKMMDNESYKINHDGRTRTACDKEKSLRKTDSEKHKVQIILNKISHKPQIFKDILNYLEQRLNSEVQTPLIYTSDIQVTDNSDESVSKETESVSSEKEVLNESFSKKTTSASYSNNDSIEEEITYVKKAFSTENAVDGSYGLCNKDSVSFNHFYIGDKKLNTEAVDKDRKTDNRISESKIQQMIKHGHFQPNNCTDDIVKLMNAEESSLKHTIDMMENEKNETSNVAGDLTNSKDVADMHVAEELDNYQTDSTISESKIQQMIKHGHIQPNNCSDDIVKLMNAEESSLKHTIDMMENEKNETSNVAGDLIIPKDVADIHIAEGLEESFEKFGHAECHDLSGCIQYSDFDSTISNLSYKFPSDSCFMSSVTEAVSMKNDSLMPIFSMNSIILGVKNRLSLEWLVPRTVCCYCNIIVSRQTNTSSISLLDDREFHLNETKQHCLTEDVVLHAEKKVCNVAPYEDSSDLNVCNISLSNKYVSKGVIIMVDPSFPDISYISPEQCGLECQDSIFISDVSFQSNFKELSDPEHINSAKGTKKEAVQLKKWDFKCTQEDETQVINREMKDADDSLGQNHGMKTEIEELCRDLGNPDSFFTCSVQNKVGKILKVNKEHQSKDRHENTEYIFKELKDIENKDEHQEVGGDKMKSSFGKIKYPHKRSGNKDFQERKIKYKSNKLKNLEFWKKKKLKQCVQRRGNYYLEEQSHNQDWPVGVTRGTFNKDWGDEEKDYLTKLDEKQEQNLQDNCRKDNWMSGSSQKFDLNTPKKKDGQRQKGNFAKNKSKKDKKFAEKSGCDIDSDKLFSKRNIRNGGKNKQKQGNYKQFRSDKSVSDIDFSGRGMQCYLKHYVSVKRHTSKHFKHGRGNSFHLDEDPPIRLHLVKAKVCSRSGGDGGYGRSGNGSTDGMQGDGNRSSNREAGSGRPNSNGSGSSSDGDGNQDNNNGRNNGHSKEWQNSANKKKEIKPKKQGQNNLDDNIPPETIVPGSSEQGNNETSTNASPASPSLPTPHLDPKHIAERRVIEMTSRFLDEPPKAVVPSVKALAVDQSGLFEASALSGIALDFLPDNEEKAPDIQHSVVSIFQLCDTIGEATNDIPPESETFRGINVCLTRIIHDLTLAADDDDNRVSCDNCNVCLVLSQLLIHQANPDHDGLVGSCHQCAQIFNLMMCHCIGCIQSNRQKTRHTQSDLCYKICKYLRWDAGQLNKSVNKLKGKVLKYCDKVLGRTADMVPLRYMQGDTSEGIGEIGMTNLVEIPSTSSTTLSLGGNIVTTETGDQEQQQTHPEEVMIPHSSLTSGTPAHTTSSIPAGSDSPCHMRLSRKPSQRRTPAIPPPIVEENQAFENSAASYVSTNEERQDDIEDVIYRRYRTTDFDTETTYGERNQYGSLPLGHMHDGTQFLSVSTQPTGSPGIGEVVFGHAHRLGIVAKFWGLKRDECERTQTCPYQLREEGVILADQKENFSILHTRYQKHQQWERVSHLGNGMSGKCHLAIDLKTNFKFCCKKIHLLKYTEEELSLWSEMHNAYIVRLYGAIRHGVKIYIFSEFIDGGSLAACIEEQKRLGRRLSHWSAINYFQQLLKVLAFLQKKNILHEDIKADNILLRRNSTYLAVTDFGTSRRLQDPKELKNKSPVGSPTHWSPEKASMEGHGFPSDMWAAVCVLVHMLSGEPPWLKRFMQKAAILNFIIYYRSPPMEDVPNNVQLVVRDLIEKGFVKDPQVRPSSSELLQHQAFKILDEGKPETYYSTLASMAPSGLQAMRTASAAVNDSQNANKEVSPANALNSISTRATVLFERNVNAGPYQESDSRSDRMNQQSYTGLLRASNNYDSTNSASVGQIGAANTKTNENQPEEVESNAATDTEHVSLHLDENASIEDDKTVLPSKTVSKGNQLVEPFDINKLLPQFDELFESGDSTNTQSIKDFFIDNCIKRDLSDVRQPPLQVYKPEERTDELPNLSIFDDTCEATAQLNDTTPIPREDTKMRFPLFQSSSHSPVNYILSSESEDFTSADLFDFDPAAKNPATTQSASKNLEIQAMKEASNTQKQNVYPPGDVNSTVSSGSNPSSLCPSNLQQRKPTNLTLNVTASHQPSGLSHSQSDMPASSDTNAHAIEQKNRSQISYHTGNTPLSSHSASALGRTGGTSVPSTASSGNSHFYLQSSVVEDQLKAYLELTSDMNQFSPNQFSPTDSNSDNLFSEDYQNSETADNTEASEYGQGHNMQASCNTMLEEIDSTMLGGYNLNFFNDTDAHIFTMRIEALPPNWKSLIQSVRRMISKGFSHFGVYHMDNTPVKFNHPLSAYNFKVIHRQDEGIECWCQRCYPMY